MNARQDAPAAQSKAAEKTRIVAQTPEVRVVEYVLGADDSLSWHFHSAVSDRFYCLEGLISVEIRDPAQKIFLHPGETFAVPSGVVHRSRNAGNGISRYLLVQGVGRYDFVKAD